MTIGVETFIPGVDKTQINWFDNTNYEIKDGYLYLKYKNTIENIYNMKYVSRIIIR